MTIINQPYVWTKNGYESPGHIKAKQRVAKIGDTYLESIKQKGWKVITIYEYQFPTLLTELGQKRYMADIYFEVSYIQDYQMKRHAMSCEIDGLMGHSGDWEQMKDRVRDEKLSEQLGCSVVRFETDSLTGIAKKRAKGLGRGYSIIQKFTPITDQEILDILNLRRNMKLPTS